MNKQIENIVPVVLVKNEEGKKNIIKLEEEMLYPEVLHDTVIKIRKTALIYKAVEMFLILQMTRTEDEHGNKVDTEDEAVVIIHETYFSTDVYMIPIERGDQNQIEIIGQIQKTEVKDFTHFTNILNYCAGNS